MGRPVLVVGGGIAGLAVAREILLRGGEPLVLEESDRVGGCVRSEIVDGALVEHGPQGFLGEHPGVLGVVDDLGLRDRLRVASDASRRRYVLHRGRLSPLPLSPAAFLTSPLLSWRGKLRVLAEPWARPAPPGPESVHDFAARRIGREAAEVLLDAAVTGIYAGDPRRLGVRACFPKMVDLEREHGGLFRGLRARRKRQEASAFGKRLHSFEGGMEDLVRALERALGDRIRRGVRIARIERRGKGWTAILEGGPPLEAASLVLAVPAHRAARILNGFAPELAALLEEIPTAPVAVVGTVFARDAVGHTLDGYGFLQPGGASPVLGCLFESTVFPGRAPDGSVLLRTLIGGARRPEATQGTEEKIVETALEGIRAPLDLHGPPRAVRCVVHPRAIPQYGPDHPARLERIAKAVADLPGLHLAGAAYRGVSVNHLVGEASGTAERVLAEK